MVAEVRLTSIWDSEGRLSAISPVGDCYWVWSHRIQILLLFLMTQWNLQAFELDDGD